MLLFSRCYQVQKQCSTRFRTNLRRIINRRKGHQKTCALQANSKWYLEEDAVQFVSSSIWVYKYYVFNFVVLDKNNNNIKNKWEVNRKDIRKQKIQPVKVKHSTIRWNNGEYMSINGPIKLNSPNTLTLVYSQLSQ